MILITLALSMANLKETLQLKSQSHKIIGHSRDELGTRDFISNRIRTLWSQIR